MTSRSPSSSRMSRALPVRPSVPCVDRYERLEQDQAASGSSASIPAPGFVPPRPGPLCGIDRFLEEIRGVGLLSEEDCIYDQELDIEDTEREELGPIVDEYDANEYSQALGKSNIDQESLTNSPERLPRRGRSASSLRAEIVDAIGSTFKSRRSKNKTRKRGSKTSASRSERRTKKGKEQEAGGRAQEPLTVLELFEPPPEPHRFQYTALHPDEAKTILRAYTHDSFERYKASAEASENCPDFWTTFEGGLACSAKVQQALETLTLGPDYDRQQVAKEIFEAHCQLDKSLCWTPPKPPKSRTTEVPTDKGFGSTRTPQPEPSDDHAESNESSVSPSRSKQGMGERHPVTLQGQMTISDE